MLGETGKYACPSRESGLGASVSQIQSMSSDYAKKTGGL